MSLVVLAISFFPFSNFHAHSPHLTKLITCKKKKKSPYRKRDPSYFLPPHPHHPSSLPHRISGVPLGSGLLGARDVEQPPLASKAREVLVRQHLPRRDRPAGDEQAHAVAL